MSTLKDSTPLPSLFISHGAPDLLIDDSEAHHFLKKLGNQIQPSAIVIVSAHWQTQNLAIKHNRHFDTHHDFYNWPAELYEQQYPAQSTDELFQTVIDTLSHNGLTAVHNDNKALDHGVWIPLSLMYPTAEIPILQLSLLRNATPQQHFAVGMTLSELRHQNILIIGSGGLVHNLKRLLPKNKPTEDWANAFEHWFLENSSHQKFDYLFDYRSQAPHAIEAHPTDEHLMPFFFAMGAAGTQPKADRIHHSFNHGNISMSAYAFS